MFSIPYIVSCTHTHNTHALFIYFYTAEILDEIRKNKFEKPTPIQVFNLYDWTGLCNHLCVNLKNIYVVNFFCYCSGFGCIQSQCWPILLQGLDLIGTAQVCGGCSPVECTLVIVHGELYEHAYIWSCFVCFLLFYLKLWSLKSNQFL